MASGESGLPSRWKPEGIYHLLPIHMSEDAAPPARALAGAALLVHQSTSQGVSESPPVAHPHVEAGVCETKRQAHPRAVVHPHRRRLQQPVLQQYCRPVGFWQFPCEWAGLRQVEVSASMQFLCFC